ncbi:hypothetical protein SUGI_0044890 [Cryptomeria japonica]|nr:hypothetical protein SUGI_0044890 [Cryptomeria japonica]
MRIIRPGKDEAVAIVRADPNEFDVFPAFASSELLKSRATVFAGSLQGTPFIARPEGLLGFATHRSWRGLGSEAEEMYMVSKRGRMRRILMECLAIVLELVSFWGI